MKNYNIGATKNYEKLRKTTKNYMATPPQRLDFGLKSCAMGIFIYVLLINIGPIVLRSEDIQQKPFFYFAIAAKLEKPITFFVVEIGL